MAKYVKKRAFLIAVRNIYCNDSIDYLLALRDSLNLLIIDKVKEGGVYQETIDKSKGLLKV